MLSIIDSQFLFTYRFFSKLFWLFSIAAVCEYAIMEMVRWINKAIKVGEWLHSRRQLFHGSLSEIVEMRRYVLIRNCLWIIFACLPRQKAWRINHRHTKSWQMTMNAPRRIPKNPTPKFLKHSHKIPTKSYWIHFYFYQLIGWINGESVDSDPFLFLLHRVIPMKLDSFLLSLWIWQYSFWIHHQSELIQSFH